MPIPGGPFYAASKHAILGIYEITSSSSCIRVSVMIASSPVWNSRYRYVLSLTILYRYRYRPSSGPSDSGGNPTHTSITHCRGHFSCCLESGSWDERWWSTVPYGAGQGVYKMMDNRVNALFGLGLIGWLGVRNDITDSLSCSEIGSLLLCLSGSLATSWKTGCCLEYWSCSGQIDVGFYRKLCPIVAWS